MYQLIIVPSNSTANISLTYKTLTGIEAALKKCENIGVNLVLTDDFGYKIHMPVESYSYAMMIDVAKSQSVLLEREIAVKAGQEIMLADPRSLEFFDGQKNTPNQRPASNGNAPRPSSLIMDA